MSSSRFVESSSDAERKFFVDVLVSAVAAILIAVLVWLYSGSSADGLAAGLTTATIGVSLAAAINLAVRWLRHRELGGPYRNRASQR